MSKNLITCFSVAAAAFAFSVNAWASLVNINSADAEELAEMIVGVGPSLAGKIIADREANGPYKTVDELVRVQGIGQKTLEKNRTSLTVETSSGTE